MKNNLFDYATSELSQDAFICWLCNWINFEESDLNQDERNLKKLATEFIENMLEGKKIDGKKVKILKQYNKIDVLLKIENKKTNEIETYIIIEDKIGTGLHNDQIEEYKKKIEEENKDKNNNEGKIITVYYKIWDQCNIKEIGEKVVDKVYDRRRILELFENYHNKTQNRIFSDYYDYLKKIEEEIKSYKQKNLKEWNHRCYIGFFKYLQDEKKDLIEGGCGWGYVPKGDFMGFWWFPLNEGKLKNLVNDHRNENVYLQIEQHGVEDIIAVKYSVTKKYEENKELQAEEFKDKVEKASERRKIIYKKLKEKLGDSFNKKNFQRGKYMTVGYLTYDSKEDCEDKIKILQNTLKELEI